MKLFFFNQKTAYEMRISDWSSDVCSSDLLPFQQRHEHFVQGYAQNGWFVGRLAGIGAVVNGLAAHGDALYGKDRKPILLVVITGMVAVRAFQRHFVGGVGGAGNAFGRHGLDGAAVRSEEHTSELQSLM